MGQHDCYCAVSGAHYFSGTDELIYELCHMDTNMHHSYYERGEKNPVLSDKLRKGLYYSEEDVESSSSFVIFCQFETLDDGTIIKYADFEDPYPPEYTASTITEVFNVYPGNRIEYGEYTEVDGESFYVLTGNNFVVTYTSYLILKQVAPEVKPHTLYALVYGRRHDVGYHRTTGNIEGIDYGPVGRTFEQFTDWLAICDNSDGRFKNPIRFWRWLLTQEGRTDEDILQDAWRGPGNMWVFVRPDRFPVAETLVAKPILSFQDIINTEPTVGFTLGSLPLDVILAICECLPIRTIYALITTCRRFRSIILPHVNPISRRRLIEEEPWYLPAGPFKLNLTATNSQGVHGREEIEWWEAQWAAGGISPEDMDDRIPWFIYRKECSKSMSMWNRKRIWGIAKQLDALARDRGLL